MRRRVSWWDGYSRPWQLPERFLGGANEAAPSSPATAAAPERFRASCADEGVGAASPLALGFPSVETDRVVRAGDAGAQSQNLEAQPAPTGVDSAPGSAEARGEGRPAPLPTEGPSVGGSRDADGRCTAGRPSNHVHRRRGVPPTVWAWAVHRRCHRRVGCRRSRRGSRRRRGLLEGVRRRREGSLQASDRRA